MSVVSTTDNGTAGPEFIYDDVTRTFKTVLENITAGIYPADMEIVDDLGQVTTCQVDITVSPGNVSPIISPDTPPATPLVIPCQEGTGYDFDANTTFPFTLSDPDGTGPFTVALVAQNPENSQVIGAGNEYVTLNFAGGGATTFDIVVTDGAPAGTIQVGISATDTPGPGQTAKTSYYVLNIPTYCDAPPNTFCEVDCYVPSLVTEDSPYDTLAGTFCVPTDGGINTGETIEYGYFVEEGDIYDTDPLGTVVGETVTETSSNSGTNAPKNIVLAIETVDLNQVPAPSIDLATGEATTINGQPVAGATSIVINSATAIN